MTKRLDLLKSSLSKKNALFDSKLSAHLDDVRSANGQPLNDKRNGGSTLNRWDKQNDALRNLQSSIKTTERAIEKEETKISNVGDFDVPEVLKPLLESGVITQWRRHPRFFFVKGVERARLSVQDSGAVVTSYVKEIPTQEQYAIFRDVFNAVNQAQRASPTKTK